MEVSAQTCARLRCNVLTMLHAAGSGHAGGSLSCIELLTALYGEIMRVDPRHPTAPDRDRFVLSKGHAAPALYAVLAEMGYFPKEDMQTLRRLGSRLQGHPDKNKLPGIDMSTGSLGQGFSIAVGMALGAKRSGSPAHVFTLTGDGEQQEGLCWEAAMAAAHYHLDNLTVLVDWNGLQIDGANDEVMSLGDLAAKYRAFGFTVYDVDGHDLDAIVHALHGSSFGKPRCLLAHTVKGKGVSFYENQVGSHGVVPNEKQLAAALAELQKGA